MKRKIPITQQMIDDVIKLRDIGLTQAAAAEVMNIAPDRMRSICVNKNINGWPTGSAARDQTGELNPNFKTGLSDGTLSRLAVRVVTDAGKSLYVCEICSVNSSTKLHVHHRDKNRQNNTIENLQVLCPKCHMREHSWERFFAKLQNVYSR